MKKLTTLILMVVVCGAVWAQTYDKITLTGAYSQIRFEPVGLSNYYLGTKSQDGIALGLWGGSENAWLTYWKEGSGDMIIHKGNISLNNGNILLQSEKYLGYTAVAGSIYKIGLKKTGVQSYSGGSELPWNDALTIESDALITFHETDANVIRGWMDVNNNKFIWSGRVGVGTSNPTSNLDVNGSTTIRNRLQIGNVSSAWLGDVITGYSNGINVTDAAIFVPVNLNSASDLRLYIPDDGNDAFSIWGNTCGGGNCSDLNAASQVARFEGNGRASFFGDVTVDATLDVNGNIKAHEIEVTLAAMQDLQLNGTLAANKITYTANGNTADFVFEDNYQLKDLSEVEAFIKTNKHLPEIPSAEEMEKAGVNLAEMNKLLLMKVEELTLYSIELEKRDKAIIEKLECELKEQKAELQLIKEMILSK